MKIFLFLYALACHQNMCKLEEGTWEFIGKWKMESMESCNDLAFNIKDQFLKVKCGYGAEK